jgi:hypothetical protein
MSITLYFAATGGVDEFLSSLGDDGVAIVIEPIEQRPDGGELLILDGGRVVEGVHQCAAALKFLQQALVVDVEAERLGRGVKIGTIDEEHNLGGYG